MCEVIKQCKSIIKSHTLHQRPESLETKQL